MSRNEVYVTTDLQDTRLWKKELKLVSSHWINDAPEQRRHYEARIRYRQPLVSCSVKPSAESVTVTLDEDIRAITPGQSAVIYEQERVVGGGIVR